MKKLRVGLCGLGFMGGAHLSAYAKIREAEVVAICHASAKRFQIATAGNLAGLEGGRAILRTAHRYDDLAAMLASERLDLADICTPTDTHAALACRALRAGVHVLCEKPMALTVSQCDRMIRAARKARRFLMIAHVLRWWPEYVFLREMVRSRKYGFLRGLHLLRATAAPTWAPWMKEERRSGGPLLDLHIHDLDQVLWLLGKPRAVTASLSRDRRRGSVLYHFRHSVATAEYAADMAGGFGFNMSYRAQFNRATVVYDLQRKPSLTLWAGGRETHPKLPAKNAYAEEIRAMLQAIRSKRAPTRVTPAEASDAVALALLERRSGMTGRTLRLPD